VQNLFRFCLRALIAISLAHIAHTYVANVNEDRESVKVMRGNCYVDALHYRAGILVPSQNPIHSSATPKIVAALDVSSPTRSFENR